MSRPKPNHAINASCLVALLLTLLLAGWLLPASARNPLKSEPHNPDLAQQVDAPVALIKSIIVAGPNTPTTEWDVTVQRADSTSEQAQTGTFLYRGDQVITHNAQSTLLFLDEVAEKNNEVVIQKYAQIQIGSIYDLFGDLIVRVKGFFETKTDKVKLGVIGTEYQLSVGKGGDNRIIVLEGVVTVDPGRFSPSAKRLPLEKLPETTNANSDVFVRTSLTQEESASQPSRPIGSRAEQQTLQAGKKEEVTVTSTNVDKHDATDVRIQQAVAWSNDVIIESHQSYAAQSIAPNFRDADERARIFRQARLNAALSSDALSYKELGDALLDMGDGAKALDAYEHLLKIARPTPESLTNLGEAYRLAGRFQEAADVLNRALKLNSNWAPTFNALGNLDVDLAAAERDKHNYDAARGLLDKAKDAYIRASQTLPPNAHHQTRSASGPRIERGIVQSNLGEVYKAFGDIAQDQGHDKVALDQYQVAEQAFKQAQESSPRYAFAHTGLGGVYREINKVASSRGDKGRAADAFKESEVEYSTAIQQHKDIAPAYVGLGNLYENAGGKEAALKFYTKATQMRPEEPTGHYHLALVLAKTNPRLAAAHAHTYLSVERKPLRQGERAQKARSVSGEEAGGRTFAVPDVRNRDLREAIGILQQRQLGYDIGNQKGNYVVSQDPKPGSMVDQGSNVRLTLRTRDEGGGTENPRVPDVRNKDFREAIGILRQLKLGYDIGNQKGNYVVSQDPKPGTLVDQGSNVRLTLRTRDEGGGTENPGRIRVPDVRNKDFREAIGILRQLQLGYDIGNQKGNYVVSQDPKPGSMVDQGSNVRLTLRTRDEGGGTENPKRIRVPDVRLKDLQEAIGILRQQQLGHDIGDQKGNFVVNQNPRPGTLVEPGSNVRLTLISKFTGVGGGRIEPRRVRVPDVRNKGIQEAESILKQHQLDYDIGDQKGDYVASQNPKPGSLVEPGRKIHLVLAYNPRD